MPTMAGERALEITETIRRLSLEMERLAEDAVSDRELLDIAQASAMTQSATTATHTFVVGRVDVRAAQIDDGLESPVSWLGQNTQVARAHARRIVARATLLRRAPLLAERFRDGRLSADQIDVFAKSWNDRVGESLLTLEEPLADLAEASSVDQLAKDLRSLLDALDDGAEPDPGHRDRGLTVSQGFDGRYEGRFTLSSVAGAKVTAVLDALVERYRIEDRESGQVRNATQRRADALVALVTGNVSLDVSVDLVLPADQVPGFDPASLDPGGPSRRPTPSGADPAPGPEQPPDEAPPDEAPSDEQPPDEASSIAALGPKWRAAIGLSGIGYGARLLHSQRRISEAATLALAASARFRAVVVNPHNGAVLYLGRRTRLASAGQRDALAIESGGSCAIPGCGRPALYTDAHHVVAWAGPARGRTDQGNLLPLCGTDHDLAHRPKWTITKDPNDPAAGPGGAVVRRPDGTVIDPRPGWGRSRTVRPPRTARPRDPAQRTARPGGQGPRPRRGRDPDAEPSPLQ